MGWSDKLMGSMGYAPSTPAELSYAIGDQPKTMPWGPDREREFQTAMQNQSPYSDWNAQFRQRYGEAPNLDDPQYNYRLAYALGQAPEPYAHDNGAYHWTSSVPVPPYAEPADLKGTGHQSLWMERFMRLYGVDPFEASADQLQDGIRRGVIPMRGN